MRAMSLSILCYTLQTSNSATGLEDVVAKPDPQRSYAASALFQQHVDRNIHIV